MQPLPRLVNPATSVEWSCYLNAIYGEIPRQNVNIASFDLLYVPQLGQCGINISKYDLPTRLMPYITSNGGRCCTPKGTIRINIGITHYRVNANNTWIEITHCARGQTEAGFWMYAQKGSGVFVNLGQTAVFLSHRDALQRVLDPLGMCRSPKCNDYRVGGRDNFWNPYRNGFSRHIWSFSFA